MNSSTVIIFIPERKHLYPYRYGRPPAQLSAARVRLLESSFFLTALSLIPLYSYGQSCCETRPISLYLNLHPGSFSIPLKNLLLHQDPLQ